MFGKKTSSGNTGSIDCLIGVKTRIEGDVQFEGGLRVDGQVKGNVLGNQNSVLIISELAQLEGEVRAAQAIINGRITGTVRVADRLELQAKARVVGDVQYRTLEMHPGAVVEGRLIHQDNAEADSVVKLDIEAHKANRQTA
ncbi:polymer-forming cytoskeletal family protein [Parasulfuritortus cantonensis]|uniref:Polymer-forming cytoskeletal family protein n=1 Tax=Parasulfuritortus cantonensis TaxID=2528202 RepID=A0A4R1B1H5_9PROT|nr:polymer-forming cytoskeletal protein [Parasulfuritortus cantonensis]TCJ11872.1 polymer-forming cytoskeletal family protein [Parasulfuritortus cantonensis]